jgi:predicted ArsR family transcriptional regulator
MPKGQTVSVSSVRSAAAKLKHFTAAELGQHLGVTRDTANRHIEQMILDGIVRSAGVKRGNGRPAPQFAFKAPTAVAVARRKEATPEQRVAAAFVTARSRGSVVSGGRTRRKRAGRGAVRQLIASAERQGAEIKEQKHGYAVVKDGRTLGSIPKTASDHRSLKNARAELKRGGLAA